MRKASLAAALLAVAACGGTTGGGEGLNTDAGTNTDGGTITSVIQSFSAASASIAAGQSVQLTATFSSGTGTIDHNVGAVQSGVPVTVTPSENTTYTLVVTTADAKTFSSSATVLVTGAVCIGSTLMSGLGKTHLMAGASMADGTAKLASWDIRYLYIAGGLQTGATPCTTCDASCSNGGWWGCYQQPVGQYAKSVVSVYSGDGQIPWFTYYEVLQSSGAGEGTPEVQALNNAAYAPKYLGDLRFLFQQIGNSKAMVHIEPDFWAYAQQLNADPTKIPVQLSSFSDCGTLAPNLAGFVQCIFTLRTKYAPNVRVGLHASVFASGTDVSTNSNPALDVAGEAKKVANFLKAVGADAGDFIVMDASDRDAGYYASIGNPHAWDATNQTLPDFHQDFTWAQTLSETLGLPMFYWQVPVGDPNENNTNNHWKDNRVDYFYAHTDELAAAHVAGMLFGAGDGNQTTPESDNGYLTAKQKTYAAGSGQAVCH
jgi:hypothetical protein